MIFSSLSLVLAVMAIGSLGQLPQYTVEFKFDEKVVELEQQVPILFNPALVAPGPVRNLSIFLLQTNATDGVQIDTFNTVKLLDVRPGKQDSLI
jgi:hypothetical protein